MRLDYLPGDPQAKAETAESTAWLRLFEKPKDACLVFGGNTRSSIAHLDANRAAIDGLKPDTYRLTGSVRVCIAQQIGDEPVDALAVPGDTKFCRLVDVSFAAAVYRHPV